MEDIAYKYKVSACAVIMSSARPMGTLETTLASHAAIHSAEGHFFREAILHAAEVSSIPCKQIKEKELQALILDKRLTAMRKILGPPWTLDEKYATLAAWSALVKFDT
jgi:hypothetical protein